MQKQEFRQRIYRYILRLLQFLSKVPKTPILSEIIRQVTRSGTSMGANYFEAEGASSKRDYTNFFTHSLKSANETKFWLAVLRDSGLVPENLEPSANLFLEETKELANIFASSVLTMRGKRK